MIDPEKKETPETRAQMFNVLADLAQVGIFVADTNGGYQYVNPYWTKLTGLSANEAMGSGWTKTVHPDDRDIVLENWNSAIREGREFRAEFRFLNPEGKSIWNYSVADPQHDGLGRVIRYAGMNIDISKRKESEEKLKQSENLLRESQRVANMGSYLMDVATGGWVASESLNSVLGVDQNHTHSTEEWLNIIHPDDRASVEKYFKDEVMGKVALFDKEYRIIRPNDQALRWVHGLGRFEVDAGGRPARLIGTIQDITQRKEIEDGFRRSEKLYRSLFENMLNGFAYCQMFYGEKGVPEDFKYVKVNAAFERLTGLKNVEGKLVSEVIPGIRQSDPELFATYGRVAATGNPEVVEIFVKGLQMWFLLSVYSPEKGYFVAVFDVITERKKNEEALMNKLQEIEKINKLMVGRELEMIELKNQLEELRAKMGKQ